MRLPDFILANTDSILAEWDRFARSIWPAAGPSLSEVRDHAEAILQAVALDMKSLQTAQEQSDKSKGLRETHSAGGPLNEASRLHAIARAGSGFGLDAVMSEYRALRASVVRLWVESLPESNINDLADLTRFDEAMDQSLAEAMHRFSEHLDKSRQMFLGILGHDLRTPLNAVTMLAQCLVETNRDPGTTEIASQIISSNDAAGRLLNDFLDFAVSRLGRPMPVTPAPTDFAALCREVVAEVRACCPRLRCHIEAGGEIRGEWDRARVRQLLSNLINNAVQHGDPASEISVSVAKDGSQVVLVVHNEGPPIPGDLLSRIFDPLVRGLTSQRQRGSVGLGLYIAREVVVAHGGTIQVTSTPSGGTTFTVTLPLNCKIGTDGVDQKRGAWSEGAAILKKPFSDIEHVGSGQSTA